MRSRLECFALIAVLMIHFAAAQRIIVKHKPDHTALLAAFAEQERLAVVGQASGLLVLERQHTQLRPAQKQSLLIKVRRWPGVEFAEEDLPRYMHRPLPAPSSIKQTTEAQQARSPSLCIEKDLPINKTALIPEYMPYGVPQIQATSPKLPNRTDDKGTNSRQRFVPYTNFDQWCTASCTSGLGTLPLVCVWRALEGAG